MLLSLGPQPQTPELKQNHPGSGRVTGTRWELNFKPPDVSGAKYYIGTVSTLFNSHKVIIIPIFQMKKLRLRVPQGQSEWQQGVPLQINLVPKPTFLVPNKRTRD